jgi:hypothetical protein
MTSWKAIWSVCSEVVTTKIGIPVKRENDIPNLTENMIPPEDWRMSVSITRSGSLTLSFTLGSGIVWSRMYNDMILNSAQAVCTLIDNCC